MIRQTFKLIGEGERVYVGDDRLGIPQYRVEQKITPFQASIQPFSNKLATDRYGLNVEVTDLLYVRNPPAELDKGATIVGNGLEYEATECLKYQRHYKVLIKKTGEDNGNYTV